MKYYKSTTSKTYMFEGKVIPNNKDNKWLSLSSDEALSFEKSAVISSLLKGGGIISTDKEPASMSRDYGTVVSSNAKLQIENDALRDQVKKLELEVSRQLTQNEAAAALKAKSDELEALQAQHDELQQKYDELQQKYGQLEAEAKAKIAELEAQLSSDEGEDEE